MNETPQTRSLHSISVFSDDTDDGGDIVTVNPLAATLSPATPIRGSSYSNSLLKDVDPITLNDVPENDETRKRKNSIVDWSFYQRYGLPLGTSCKEKISEEAMWWLEYSRSITQSTAEWQRLLSLHEHEPPSPRKWKTAMHVGVAPQLRAQVWPRFSGIQDKISQNVGYVSNVLQSQQSTYTIDRRLILNAQIPGSTTTGGCEYLFDALESDLQRLFPEHVFFGPDGQGRDCVRNVVRVLLWRNPLIGYCQSLVNLAGVLALALGGNDDAVFWHLIFIVENVLPNDYFTGSLLGLKVDENVLLEILPMHAPKLHKHFLDHNIDISGLLPGWLMNVFVTLFPIETTLRIFDVMFLDSEGSTITLKVVLAILRLYADDLMMCDCSGDVAVKLTSECNHLYDAVKLMRSISYVVLTSSQLRKLRYRHRMELMRPIVTTGSSVTSLPENASPNVTLTAEPAEEEMM